MCFFLVLRGTLDSIIASLKQFIQIVRIEMQNQVILFLKWKNKQIQKEEEKTLWHQKLQLSN